MSSTDKPSYRLFEEGIVDNLPDKDKHLFLKAGVATYIAAKVVKSATRKR